MWCACHLQCSLCELFVDDAMAMPFESQALKNNTIGLETWVGLYKWSGSETIDICNGNTNVGIRNEGIPSDLCTCDS